MFKGANISSVRNFFTKGHERTLRAKRNVSVSFICKGVSILITFLIVPLTLNYVGETEYGIWMTISSIVQWFAFFDIGLGNGLRNKLAEAIAINDKKTARIYISSVFFLISLIAILMLSAFFIAAHFISWNIVLNTDSINNHELFRSVMIVFIFFCIGFVSNLISSILQALQRYALNDILGLISQIFGLVAIYILVKTTEGSLFSLCLIYSGKSAIVMTIAGAILFFGTLKEYRPSIKFIDLKEAMPLLRLGTKFFVSQILYLIVTQTSVILVVQFFGPKDVTIYNLALRYTTITSMLYMMILTPFLSAFTEAYAKKDLSWIKKTISKINRIWIFTSACTLIMVLISKVFFHFWVGDKIFIPLSLVAALAITSIASTWSSTYSLFLNGIGKINVQLYVLITQAVLVFPLTYIFYKLNFGLISLVATQLVFALGNSLIMTVQYRKIVNQTATGIWFK